MMDGLGDEEGAAALESGHKAIKDISSLPMGCDPER